MSRSSRRSSCRTRMVFLSAQNHFGLYGQLIPHRFLSLLCLQRACWSQSSSSTICQKLASSVLKSSEYDHRMFPLEPLFFTSCWLTLLVLCLIYLFFNFLSFLPLLSHSHIPLTSFTTATKYCIRTASEVISLGHLTALSTTPASNFQEP
jgi:hypothetical protein